MESPTTKTAKFNVQKVYFMSSIVKDEIHELELAPVPSGDFLLVPHAYFTLDSEEVEIIVTFSKADGSSIVRDVRSFEASSDNGKKSWGRGHSPELDAIALEHWDGEFNALIEEAVATEKPRIAQKLQAAKDAAAADNAKAFDEFQARIADEPSWGYADEGNWP
jgi:hypothetical protein